MAGRHRLRTWRRHRRGEAVRAGSRLAGVTDAGTLVGQLVTGGAAGDGRGALRRGVRRLGPPGELDR